MTRFNVGNERRDDPANDLVGDIVVKAEGPQPVIEFLRIHSLPKERRNHKGHFLEGPQIPNLPLVNMVGVHEVVELRFKLPETGQALAVKTGYLPIHPAAVRLPAGVGAALAFAALQAKQRHDLAVAEPQHQLFHFTKFCHISTSV